LYSWIATGPERIDEAHPFLGCLETLEETAFLLGGYVGDDLFDPYLGGLLFREVLVSLLKRTPQSWGEKCPDDEEGTGGSHVTLMLPQSCDATPSAKWVW
jgi:hypothetical protein